MTAQHPECLRAICQIGLAAHVGRVHELHNRASDCESMFYHRG